MEILEKLDEQIPPPDKFSRLVEALAVSYKAMRGGGMSDADAAKEARDFLTCVKARYASFKVTEDSLVLNTRPVHIEYKGETYNLGKFTMSIPFAIDEDGAVAGNIVVESLDLQGHPHGNDGDECFGNAEDALYKDLRAGRLASVALMLDLWVHSYNPREGADITDWPVVVQKGK